MLQDLINRAIAEEDRGKAKWGQIDRTPVDVMIAIQEEIGEVAHAINHNEGASVIQQEIAESVGLLSRLYEMVGD
ncbi:hypothetical protein ES704_01635 [subsurface metagenome]|jgi:NTP pyrophosphatase (non-canonical NTP hydrolase)